MSLMRRKIINQFKKLIDTLFVKIFIYFLSLTTLVFVVGGITYIGSIKRLEKQFIENISDKLQSAVYNIDYYLRTVQEISMNFFMMILSLITSSRSNN